MKKITTILLLLVSFAATAQLDTTKFTNNPNAKLQYSTFRVAKDLVGPVYGRWGSDTTSKLPGQIKTIGDDFYFTGSGGYWKKAGSSGGGGVGAEISTDTNFTSASDFKIPTQKATKIYVDNNTKTYTVASLRLINTVTGRIYYTSDYGGGTWIDRGASDGIHPDNTGTVLNTANGHYLERVFTGAVNVKWFGAVADGITDNYNFFKKAVYATPAGGTLFFPSGDWLVKGRLATLQNNSRKVDGIPIKSDMTYLGEEGSNIISDTNNCFIFNTPTSSDVDSATQLYKNITFRNLRFVAKNPSFFAESISLNIGSGSNVLIDFCKFYGFRGDAVSLGVQVDTATLGFFRRTYVENVKITNCEFDGINGDTRNAITIFTGKNILIQNNTIKRTTRSDMPGAIDIEPEYNWSILKDIVIDQNTFDGIGGGTGVVSYALNTSLTQRPENFIVSNNIFKNNTNTYSYGVTGNLRSDTLLSANCPKGFTFSGNTHRGSTERMLLVRGVENVTISDKLIDGFGKTSLIAFGGPVYNLNFHDNTVQNYVVNGSVYDVPFSIYGYLYNSSISNNTFVNTGNKSGSTYQNFMTFSFDDNRSKNLIVSNNNFTNTRFDTTASFALMNSLTLNSPQTIQLRNNNFTGVNQARSHVYSWYHQAVSDTFSTASQLTQKFGLSPTYGAVPRYGTNGLVNGIITDDGATVTINGDTRINYSHIRIGKNASNEGGFITLDGDNGVSKYYMGIIGAASRSWSIYDIANGNFPLSIDGTTQDASFVAKVSGIPATAPNHFTTLSQVTADTLKQIRDARFNPDSSGIELRIGGTWKFFPIAVNAYIDTATGLKGAFTSISPGKIDTVNTIATIHDVSLKLNSADYINAITLTGTVNGINTVFTLPSIPQTGTLKMHLNGQEIYITDDYLHTAGTTTVTFISPPPTGSKVRGTYFKL
jgi:hypothetical protein